MGTGPERVAGTGEWRSCLAAGTSDVRRPDPLPRRFPDGFRGGATVASPGPVDPPLAVEGRGRGARGPLPPSSRCAFGEGATVASPGPVDPREPAGSEGRAGPGLGPPESQRPSRNHRRMVRTLGGRASPPRTRSRSRVMTRAGRSPWLNAASASRRREGQEYDPGASRSGPPPVSRARCRSSERDRAAVKHPAARHTCIREATRSRPARRVRNSAERWASHSHTRTPQGRCSSARAPDPAPTQIAHAGSAPSRSPL